MSVLHRQVKLTLDDIFVAATLSSAPSYESDRELEHPFVRVLL
jgi:hypothetical protein